MKKLENDEMSLLVGGDLCGPGQNAGIICQRIVVGFSLEVALCFSCQGDFLYGEIW